jgi:hypothetical protein
MKASILAAAAAIFSVASAHYENSTEPVVTYTTEVVTAYTTYCPAATEIVHGEQTYTVTEVSSIPRPQPTHPISHNSIPPLTLTITPPPLQTYH